MPNDAKLVVSAEDRATAVFRSIAGGVKGFEGAVERVNTPLLRFQEVLATITTGAVVAGFRSLVTSIDDLDEAAQSVQVTAVALSELQANARLTGVESSELQAALTRLNVKLTDAAGGGKEAAALFRALGVEVRDASGNLRGTEAVLRDVAERFREYGGSAEESALAVELFGRSGARLLPFLNQGGESLRTFSGLTEETVREAAKLQGEFDKLAVSAERFKNALAAEVVPATNNLIDTWQRLDFARLVEATFSVEGGPSLQVKFARELARQVGAAADERERLNRATAEGAKLDGPERAAGAGTRRAPIVPTGRDTTPRAEEISESRRELAQFVETLERQRDALQEISRVEQVLQFLRDNPGVDTPQVRELLIEQARLNDQLDQERQIREELARIAREETAAIKALDDQLIEFSGRAEEARKQALTARLEARLAAGEQFSPEELERIVRGIGGVAEETRKAGDSAERFALTITSSIGRLFDEGLGSGRDFIDAFVADIGKLITQMLVLEPLAARLREIFNGFGTGEGGGGAGGGLAGLLGQLGRAFVGSFAVGTDYVPRTGLAMVHQGERIVPAAQNRGGGLGRAVINVAVPPGLGRETATQTALAVSREFSRVARRFG